MPEAALDQAMELRHDLLEILKYLNRAEMEGGDVEGLEPEELKHVLARTAIPSVSQGEVDAALRVLVGNGYASMRVEPQYAWDRGRVVSDRYLITAEGKQFLVRQLQRIGRI